MPRKGEKMSASHKANIAASVRRYIEWHRKHSESTSQETKSESKDG